MKCINEASKAWGGTPIASLFIHRKVHAYKQDLHSIFGFLLLLIKLTASQKEVCGKAHKCA